jgi:hypothetical protein
MRKRFRQYGEEFEHEHCEFCWATFADAEFSPEYREYVEANDRVFGEGYATPNPSSPSSPWGRDYFWVCDKCFADFRERFDWRVVAAD